MTEEIIEKSIGEILKETRREKNLSIKEIANYLKVKEIDIEKVESDNFDFFDKKLYLTGFLKSYAKFLKIDDKIIFQNIKKINIKSNIENKKHQLIDVSESNFSIDKIIFAKITLAAFCCLIIFLLIFKINNSANFPLEKIIYQEFNKVNIE
jgi:cytoskeletal protein RodZ